MSAHARRRLPTTVVNDVTTTSGIIGLKYLLFEVRSERIDLISFDSTVGLRPAAFRSAGGASAAAPSPLVRMERNRSKSVRKCYGIFSSKRMYIVRGTRKAKGRPRAARRGRCAAAPAPTLIILRAVLLPEWGADTGALNGPIELPHLLRPTSSTVLREDNGIRMHDR
ncbi:hypothetical protein EVAR_29602_1 [Eumeta japonica]|uniref:Uncharacterized protein n=1 Tax=Eumeta variegata TaxID=151549 RepID=A0A4C1VWY4_EUMVA|nr:hypothetical protein EVAR_29602_1 [Eumeta japonica]